MKRRTTGEIVEVSLLEITVLDETELVDGVVTRVRGARPRSGARDLRAGEAVLQAQAAEVHQQLVLGARRPR